MNPEYAAAGKASRCFQQRHLKKKREKMSQKSQHVFPRPCTQSHHLSVTKTTRKIFLRDHPILSTTSNI
eukprot:13214909-Ditylum_brightwellii.AAC.1